MCAVDHVATLHTVGVVPDLLVTLQRGTGKYHTLLTGTGIPDLVPHTVDLQTAGARDLTEHIHAIALLTPYSGRRDRSYSPYYHRRRRDRSVTPYTRRHHLIATEEDVTVQFLLTTEGVIVLFLWIQEGVIFLLLPVVEGITVEAHCRPVPEGSTTLPTHPLPVGVFHRGVGGAQGEATPAVHLPY